jgi:hypothetical protein
VRSAAKRNAFKVGDRAVRNPALANIVKNLKEPKDFVAFMRDKTLGDAGGFRFSS